MIKICVAFIDLPSVDYIFIKSLNSVQMEQRSVGDHKELLKDALYTEKYEATKEGLKKAIRAADILHDMYGGYLEVNYRSSVFLKVCTYEQNKYT